MYLPPAFAVDDTAVIVAGLRTTGFGHLISAPVDGTLELQSTALPFVVDDDLTVAKAHFARANRHWHSIDGTTALLLVPMVDAYISPRWYPSRQRTEKVVPTWNYELIHLHGTVRVHDDPQETLAIVTELTDQRESITGSDGGGNEPWAVDDAPRHFIENQLKAIVGMHFEIERVEAKRKLSQNRADDDRTGAIAGLAASSRPTDRATATRMVETGGD